MKDQRKAVADLLMDDSVLLSMLAQNKPWNNPEGELATKNSITPLSAGKMPNCPYIQVRELADNMVGTNLKDSFSVIRCYNEPDKSYVAIDGILSRVQALLHKHRFTFDGSVSIDTLYETTGSELTDETFKQNFRESQYRLAYL